MSDETKARIAEAREVERVRGVAATYREFGAERVPLDPSRVEALAESHEELRRHLAAETKRADDAERERDAYRHGSDTWHDAYTSASHALVRMRMVLSEIAGAKWNAPGEAVKMAKHALSSVDHFKACDCPAIAERDALANELDYMRRMADAYKATAEDRAVRLAAQAKVVEAAKELMNCDAIEHASYPSVVASEEASEAFANLGDALAALPADEGGG